MSMFVHVPHLSLKFESLKAFKAREEREALKTEAAKHKATEGGEGEEGRNTMLRRRNTMTHLTATDSMGLAAEPAAAPAGEPATAPAAVVVDAKAGGVAGLISKAGAKAKGAGASKLKKAATEMMEGFGRKEERRAKQVTGSATKAVEIAVEAMKDEVKRAKPGKIK